MVFAKGVSKPQMFKNTFVTKIPLLSGGFDTPLRGTRPPCIHNKKPRPWSGFDEAKHAILLLSKYAHADIPTMLGLKMMMVMRVHEVHDGQYSMTGRGMRQGEVVSLPDFQYQQKHELS